MILLENVEVDLRSKNQTKTVSAGMICIQDGEVGALVGQNGTGKTTVLRLAAGSIAPKIGKIRVDRPLIAFTDIDRQVHYRLTLVENHRFFAALYGLCQISKKKILSHLEIASLSKMSEKKAGALSKGEKARLIFSIIDAHDCASFVVDEPTNGLDDNGKQYICGVISRKLASGSSGLFSTHDRECLMDIGAIIFRANCDGLFVRAIGFEQDIKFEGLDDN